MRDSYEGGKPDFAFDDHKRCKINFPSIYSAYCNRTKKAVTVAIKKESRVHTTSQWTRRERASFSVETEKIKENRDL